MAASTHLSRLCGVSEIRSLRVSAVAPKPGYRSPKRRGSILSDNWRVKSDEALGAPARFEDFLLNTQDGSAATEE